MLRKEAVVPEMTALIKKLQGDPLFQNHILVGGTALALQLGHRTSTDIDLFTLKPQSALAIINNLRNNYKNIDVDIAKDDFTRIFIDGIKVELVEYEEKILEKPKEEDGIRYVGLNDIAAMKLDAMFKRTRPRDFIDIAYLLKEMPLEKMFELYKEKFGSISPLYIKRTLLTKSRKIQDDDWLEGNIVMLRHDIEPKNVPLFIEQAIKEYNKINNISK